MPSIQLLVTGDLERRALAESLGRWFPATISGATVEWRAPEKVSGGTSNPLTPGQPKNPMAPLARRAVATVLDLKSRRIPLPDLVIAIDDLELANHHQPGFVVAAFRAAVEEQLQARGAAHPQAPERVCVRERLSFHLAHLMPENWLFADPTALAAAGCTASPLWAGAGVEDLQVTDPASLARCAAEDARIQPHMPQWSEARHAKHYLDELVARSGGLYCETEGGAAALRALHWPLVAGTQTCPYARALFEDLAGFFACPSPLPPAAACATWPPVTARRNQLLLRNA